jgi:hypothetical protein
MPVEPNAVMIPPAPVSWHPDVIDVPRPIARPMSIIRPIAHFDIK